MLYSIVYTALPTIVVGILDKDLSKRTLLKNPQLYGAGLRQEAYNNRLFWLTMADTLWQSIAVFFVPLIAYWGTNVDVASIGDLWTLAVVILVNLHLAMDVIRWNWITHAAIWGSIVATFVCVIVIDAIPAFPGYWYVLSFPDSPFPNNLMQYHRNMITCTKRINRFTNVRYSIKFVYSVVYIISFFHWMVSLGFIRYFCTVSPFFMTYSPS